MNSAGMNRIATSAGAEMKAIIRKHIGEMGFDMVIDPDWSALKLFACQKWGIENRFDAGNGWDALRRGYVVLLEAELYVLADGDMFGSYFDVKLDGSLYDLAEMALSEDEKFVSKADPLD